MHMNDLCSHSGLFKISRTQGLWLSCQCSATELQLPPATTLCSYPYDRSRFTVNQQSYTATIRINRQYARASYVRAGMLAGGRWLLVGVVAQWQSTGTVRLRPCVRLPAAPPFFPALSPLFQRSTDSNGKNRTVIRPRLISI